MVTVGLNFRSLVSSLLPRPPLCVTAVACCGSIRARQGKAQQARAGRGIAAFCCLLIMIFVCSVYRVCWCCSKKTKKMCSGVISCTAKLCYVVPRIKQKKRLKQCQLYKGRMLPRLEKELIAYSTAQVISRGKVNALPYTSRGVLTSIDAKCIKDKKNLIMVIIVMTRGAQEVLNCMRLKSSDEEGLFQCLKELKTRKYE